MQIKKCLVNLDPETLTKYKMPTSAMSRMWSRHDRDNFHTHEQWDCFDQLMGYEI